MAVAYGGGTYGTGTFDSTAGHSFYGKGTYGLGAYSTGSPVVWSVSGALVVEVDFIGQPAVDRLVSGVLSVNVSFGASSASGPLWQPEPPCEPVVWEPAELCHG